MKLDNRIWVALTVVVCGAVLGGGWALGVQPQLAAAATAAEDQQSVEAQNAATSAEVARLTGLAKDESKLTAKLDALTSAVPPGVEGSRFLREVDALLASSGAKLKSWTVAQPIPYAPPAPPAAEATKSTGTTPTPTPSASATAPAATVETTNTIAPLTDALISSGNFITVPVGIEVAGSDAEVTAFLRGLQSSKRLMLVTQVTKSSSEEGVSLKLGGTVYVLRDPSSTTTTPAAANG